MSHELEQHEGKVAFALVGDTAWHGLANAKWDAGTVVSVSEMLEAAFLAKWNVRTEPWEIPDGYSSDKDYVRIVRTNPFTGTTDILGQALGSYTPAQNEDVATFGDALTMGGAYPETAGSIYGGKRIFLSWLLPHGMVLDESGRADEVKSYLLVTTSHDGSSSTKALVTPVRTVCRNTLMLALESAKNMVSVRHTKNAPVAIEDARKTLRISASYMDAFQREAQMLIQTDITNQQAHDIFERVYPMPDKDAGKASLTKWETKQDSLWEYYTGSTCENIIGTAWGALNALTEQVDYGTKSRSAETGLAAAAGFDAARNNKRNEMLAVVKSVALV